MTKMDETGQKTQSFTYEISHHAVIYSMMTNGYNTALKI